MIASVIIIIIVRSFGRCGLTIKSSRPHRLSGAVDALLPPTNQPVVRHAHTHTHDADVNIKATLQLQAAPWSRSYASVMNANTHRQVPSSGEVNLKCKNFACPNAPARTWGHILLAALWPLSSLWKGAWVWELIGTRAVGLKFSFVKSINAGWGVRSGSYI